ncbi:9171_t:CDS:2 [Ambispora leptoticha]|uniref:Proteasome assembly chaperone 1 n=1 Tax=Ambispora leptoticha TaxID=144679 RepID=A0A9N9ACQ3_9GLOM|nr:9167_t:CDS:2 [Ambispora leptoticha]CAG8527514.1 9171_t:CDS:2 [Ambispora leptoticha]
MEQQSIRYTYDSESGEEEDTEMSGGSPTPMLLLSLEKMKKIADSNALNKKLLSGRVLLVGIEEGGSLFLSSIKNKKIIGTLLLPGSDSIPPDPNNSEIISLIYELEAAPDVLIVFCKHQIPTERCAGWTKTLFEHVDVQSVVVFDTFAASSYINLDSEDHPYPPLVRILQTSKAASIQDIPLYEPPNLTRDLGAAILSHCEIHKIPAYLLLSLLDTQHGRFMATSSTLQAFQTAWEKLVASHGVEQGIDFVADIQSIFKTNERKNRDILSESQSQLYL